MAGILQSLLGWTSYAGTQPLLVQQTISPMELPLRILTHNIRYATSSLFDNERPWKERAPLIANELQYHTRFFDGDLRSTAALTTATISTQSGSFISLQEVLHDQLDDILCSLNGIDHVTRHQELPDGPNWAHIGVAREDGKTKGEYSPILYPVKLFKLLHFENRWLSPTPDKPSKGWDAGSERILTTGVFVHKPTSQRIAIFNTHLDNAGSQAREKSVGIIISVIERIRTEWALDKSTPLNYILTGDFNSFPTQEAYQALIASEKMVDAYHAVPEKHRYGDEVTFTGFRPDTDEDADEIGRIDFVWFGPKSVVTPAASDGSLVDPPAWTVQGYTVVPNVFDNGIFCSDHRAVVADAVCYL